MPLPMRSIIVLRTPSNVVAIGNIGLVMHNVYPATAVIGFKVIADSSRNYFVIAAMPSQSLDDANGNNGVPVP